MIIFDLFEDANKNPQGVAEAVNPALANLTPDEIKGIGMMIQNGHDIPTIIRIFDNKPTAEQITAIATANMQQGVAEGTGDDSEECWTCRGTGEGQHEGQVCSNCHGSGVEPVEHDDDELWGSDYYESFDPKNESILTSLFR